MSFSDAVGIGIQTPMQIEETPLVTIIPDLPGPSQVYVPQKYLIRIKYCTGFNEMDTLTEPVRYVIVNFLTKQG